MTASFTTRRILCTVLAAAVVALPSNSALAGPAATTTSTPPASTAPTTTPPATGTAPTSTPPATGTTPTTSTPPADGTTPPPADGTTPPTDVATNPDGTPVEGDPPDAVPEQPPPEEPKPEEVAPAPAPVIPEGPERPPEPTIGNGKYKAKGTGLMIAGGTLFGVGLAGVLTTYFLTRCPDEDLENNFACKNRQHNTFAVPATVSLALLGAVLLFVGAGYSVRYKKWERWSPEAAAKKKTALTPTFLRGGAGVSYTVKF